MLKVWTTGHLTLYTVTSICKFSLLFSKHYLGCLQQEFVQLYRALGCTARVTDHSMWPLVLYRNWQPNLNNMYIPGPGASSSPGAPPDHLLVVDTKAEPDM